MPFLPHFVPKTLYLCFPESALGSFRKIYKQLFNTLHWHGAIFGENLHYVQIALFYINFGSTLENSGSQYPAFFSFLKFCRLLRYLKFLVKTCLGQKWFVFTLTWTQNAMIMGIWICSKDSFGVFLAVWVP